MTLDLYKVLGEIADALADKGVYLPDAYKRRDRREPGRAMKERDEDRLMRLMVVRFKTQRRQIQAALETILPPTKAITEPGPDDWMKSLPDGVFIDSKAERLLLRLFLLMASNGVEVFQDSTTIGLDWDAVNTGAAAWARKYMTGFLRGLDNTTRDALREALEAFVTTPGFTLGDVVKALPFSERRAIQIAVTETTRIYAEAAQIAGRELKKQYPDVRVIKTWFTNNDDRVCPICGPLHAQVVEIDDGFGVEPGEAGLLTPPAHVGCRCWISTRTDILGG